MELGAQFLSVPCMVGKKSFWVLESFGSILSQKKIDLERSSYVGQIKHAQNAMLKIAFLYGGLFKTLKFREQLIFAQIRDP